MTIKHLHIILLSLSLIAHHADISASHTDTLRISVANEVCGLWRVTPSAYEGATNLLRPDGSITQIGASAIWHSGQDYTRPWQGTASRTAEAFAKTRLRNRSGLIAGEAAYTRGSYTGTHGSETLEASMLYPYLTVDSVGGTLHCEQYRFAGSVYDSIGHFIFGGGASYRALLEYRRVDPRPRNVTSDLNIHVSSAIKVNRHNVIALTLSARRYSHAGDMTVINPIGSAKIYHMTGPESHYVRFAGTGTEWLYSGPAYGARISCVPVSESGLLLTAGYDRQTTTQQLKDLNRLPLTRLLTESADVQCGWRLRWSQWRCMPYVYTSAARRRGTENIFGDASAGIYHQIASLQLYGLDDSRIGAGLAGQWQQTPTNHLLLQTQMYMLHSDEQHRSPDYQRHETKLEGNATLSATWLIGKCLASATLSSGYAYSHTFGNGSVSMMYTLPKGRMIKLAIASHITKTIKQISANIALLI